MSRSRGVSRIISPIPVQLIASPTVCVIGTIYGARVIVPKSGILRNLAAYHGATSGNHRVGVYDTGDAQAGVRTLLWDSGSIAVGSANAWQDVGDPGFAVKRGQQLDLVLMCDNVTATFGRFSGTSTAFSLPAAYEAVPGGASPKMAWIYAAGAYAAFPATISEANCSTASGVQFFCPIARSAPA